MDYFLHEKCGYQWADRMQELTRSERNRLWKGYLLWQVTVESGSQDDDSGADKTTQGSGLGSGDRKMLDEMNQQASSP